MTSKPLAASSLVFLALLAAAGWKGEHPERRRYQGEYARLLAQQGSGEVAPPAGIQQIDNEELGVVDRCTTCHLGVADATMRTAPQPFRTHPQPEHHPFGRYGCTICHGGQGRATTADAAHGRVKHWPRPMLPLEFIEASCSKCHRGSVSLLGRRMQEGKRLFTERACIGCHKLHRRGGTIGPPLDTVGARRTAQWLVEHFRNPQRVVPGSRMPPLRLSESDIRVLTVFMLSQVPERVPDAYLTVRPTARPPATERPPANPIQAGRRVYLRYGCPLCHGAEGRGGVLNPNAHDGYVPRLVYVADELFPQEIRDKILQGSIPEKADPEGPDPLYIMPSWRGVLSEEETHQVLVYLKSLLPKDAKTSW